MKVYNEDGLTVGELRRVLAGLPDEARVVLSSVGAEKVPLVTSAEQANVIRKDHATKGTGFFQAPPNGRGIPAVVLD